jgi:ribosomal protein S18 acetylase RimI-like enzyme
MIIRAAENRDAHSMSCIYVKTWQDTYLSVVPFGYLSSMSVSQHAQAFLKELKEKQVASFVAEDSGRVVGFVTGGCERYGNSIYAGEIYTLYVLKHYQRQGTGAKLVKALARRLGDLGIYSMLVQVLAQNPYRHFYRKINGIFVKRESITFAGEALDAEYYGWIDSTLTYR